MPAKRKNTLVELAKLSGISRKTVQKKFSEPGAPDRSEPVEDLIHWLKINTKTGVELPEDYQQRRQLAELKLKENQADKAVHDKEKVQLEVLKLRGEMAPLSEIRVEGDAIGALLSSKFSQFANEAGPLFAEKTAAEITISARGFVNSLLTELQDQLGDVGLASAAVVGREARAEREVQRGNPE